MTDLAGFVVIGLVTGAVYAVAASGLVVTYQTSSIFNIAHGAFGMVAAFAYWHLTVALSMPTFFALVLVVGVLAPAAGAALERVFLRRLVGAPVAATLVATLGLMLALIGAAQIAWPPTTTRLLPGFLPGTAVTLAGVRVTGHELVTVAAAAAVAAVLYVLLRRTRAGARMRALTDDRALLGLAGWRPERIGEASWALGAALAALAGILLAPVLQLDHLLLTLLVVNAYAAAVVGRLRSLPLTFAGALALGLLESVAVPLLPTGGWLQGLRGALPTVFLFAALLLVPEARLRLGRPPAGSAPRVPHVTTAAVWGCALVGLTALAGAWLGAGDAARLGEALAFALVMLSLVLLTGVGGQLSLCQLTFAGIGAVAAAAVGPSPLALLAAAVAAGATGVLVALPALRLHGLYLALATMAFAVLAERLFFRNTALFGLAGSVPVARVPAVGEPAFVVVLAAAFALCGVAVVAVRRSRFGRALAALRDSPAACATLGLDPRRTRLVVFALSAAVAGLAGALLGGLRGQVGPGDFEMLRSLPLLLLAVVAGITSVTGALVGGIAYAVLPLLAEQLPVGGLGLLAVGALALAVRDPHGVVGAVLAAVRRPVAPWIRGSREEIGVAVARGA